MTNPQQLIDAGVVRRDVPLGPLTTYKAGGAASYFADIATERDLDELIASGLTTEMEVLVLGRGSNLVVSDSGFEGLVVKLGGSFAEARVDGLEVEAGAAYPLPRLARLAVDGGVADLEFFVGVPGSVGGAVHQNAGCFGHETKDCLLWARVVDLRSGERADRMATDLDLSYRHSNLTADQLVVSARFRGREGNPVEGKARMREITRWRKENQPGGTLNAGSVFKNPPDIAAGALIDRLGLKGTSVGDVSVSEKHANFFVAGPNATSADIAGLIALVKDAVFDATGTILEPEIQFVGFES